MKSSKLVTIEILKRSQPTRPRKWIPRYCFIAFLLCGFAFLTYMFLCFLNVEGITDQILAAIPDFVLVIGESTFSRQTVLTCFFVPIGVVVLSIFPLIGIMKMAKYRHVYRLLAIPSAILFVLSILYYVFVFLHIFIDAMDNLFKLIPEDVMNTIVNIHPYVVLGVTGLFLLDMLFGFFYNINYPGKYEAIYDLRSQRIKAYSNPDERIAYKKRFYRDYKYGNWISMMKDLHFEALQKGSRKPIREDAYEFLVYYAGLCDGNVKKATLDAYAKEGRYYEVRNIYHDSVDKSAAVDRGAKVVVPTYHAPQENKAAPVKSQQQQQPKQTKAQKPVKAVPIKEKKLRKRYSPDEI